MECVVSAYMGNATIADTGEKSGLLRTLSRLLRPVAHLCLANGITFAIVGDILKQAFVHEAKALQPEAPEHGMVSRISTATGISRREVTRLTKTDLQIAVKKQPVAAEVLARWLTDPAYLNEQGAPRVLQRAGSTQSFEELAQGITRDVHPRSILDELVRLEIVRYDKSLDQISLVRTDFVPQADQQQMLAFLGDNVGDHLEAAVENVVDGDGRHLEQAIFADELSVESVKALRPHLAARWRELRQEMVPVITELIEADRRAGRQQDQRVRVGLYSFHARETEQASPKTSRRQRFRTAAPQGARI